MIAAMFPLPPLTDAQAGVVDRMARLARERFAARAAKYDAESSFPYENYADLHREKLIALKVPAAYGGLGVDDVTYAHAMRELAHGCSATALTFNMHSTVTTFIAALGTEAQKRRWFDDVVKHGKLIASITSEPEQSFRDKFVLNTVFRPTGDGGYHVAGLKQFCSLGDAADYYCITGIVEGEASASTGVISAIIPRESSGVKIEGVWNATGMRGTISHTIRYDCAVRPEDVLGGVGGFLTIDLHTFALGYAAVYLGIGEAAYEFMVEMARTKRRPDKTPIAEHPLVQRTVAEVGTAIRAARLLLHDAARVKMLGDREATMLAVNQAKSYCADVGLMATEKALRLAGGTGILKSLPLERWHRDALAGPVMPPANDRCLETAGKLLLGLKAATLEFE